MRVLVFGTFDRLHPGHRYLLDTAAARGSLTIVVARNSTVQRIKGRQPVESESERVAALRSAYPDAQVVLGDADDFTVPIRTVRPKLVLLGYDQQLPPGVSEADIPCPIERLDAYQPETYKSSLLRDSE